jgi:hypothetical protein
MKICRHCGCENEEGKLYCIQCCERVPDTLRYTITTMFEYLRSYEWIDWWRFELCVIGALILDAITYYFVSDRGMWFGVSVLVLIVGVVGGFIWQWRNRYNL